MKEHQYTTRKTADLIPYARNSRTHSDEQVNQVCSSIREFGFTNPVLIDDDNTIIAGHGRVMAASKIGLEEVPCINLKGLTETQKRAYVIADNKLALNSGWDDEMLRIEFDELKADGFDIELTGFSLDEVDEFEFDGDPIDGISDDDEIPECNDKSISAIGDVWELGVHKLMCGDSASEKNIKKLMGGDMADMIYSDPPYGDNHAGMTWKNNKKDKSPSAITEKIMNDSDISFLSDVCSSSMSVCKDEAPKMIFFKWSHFEEVKELFSKYGSPSSCCVWDRDEIAAACFSFNPSHEFCFFWGNLSIKHNVSSVRNVWRCKKERDGKAMHPTVKPVEIIIDAIDVACKKGGIVLDMFGGSGSTLIACEKIGRKARLMELDEKYVDVIINRWQEFTGKEAIHKETGKTYSEIKEERDV